MSVLAAGPTPFWYLTRSAGVVALHAPGKPVAHIVVTHQGDHLTAGTLVTLSGQTSQYARTFAWRQTSGPQVQLTPVTADGSVMTFVAPATGVTF